MSLHRRTAQSMAEPAVLRLFFLLTALLWVGCGSPDTPSPTSSALTPSPTAPLSTQTPEDGDGDGFPRGEDCDDDHANAYPGAPETCNRDDDDCDGITDEDPIDPISYHPDRDGDLYPGRDIESGCGKGPGGVLVGASAYYDCDDTDPEVHPFAEEQCETDADDDCDGYTDEDTLVLYIDNDLDGWGTNRNIILRCEPLDYWSVNLGDCDDMDPLTYKGAPEICDDGKDNSCNGLVDYCPTHESVLVQESLDYVTLYEGRTGFRMDACSGDVTGDGRVDLVMMKPGSRETAGVAIYSDILSDQERDFGIDTTEPNTLNARSISCDHDVDGDGVDDLLVKADLSYFPEPDSPTDVLQGQVEIFYGPITSDMELGAPDAVITAPELEAGFGRQIRRVEDPPSLLISAPGESEQDPGRVYVYGLPHARGEGGWAPVELFEHPSSYSFGEALATLEGWAATSPVDFVVGSPKESVGACEGGAVYGFNLGEGAYRTPESASLFVESEFAGAFAGTSLILADLDGGARRSWWWGRRRGEGRSARPT